MKKIHKILLVNILVVMIIISLFKIICFATNESVWDETKLKGSLNIYKFENDTTRPIKDVEFSIYKVANDCISLETPTGEATASGITEATGKVTFEIEKANFGRYLVVETTIPENDNTEATSFLVDIPMTNSDGTKWIYDVSVYPKNQTAYGSVVLNKVDENNVALQGAKFDLYKKDFTPAIVTDLITNANGQIVVNNLPFGDYYFMETLAPEGFLVDNQTKYEFSIKASGEVTYDTQNTTKAISVDNENGVRVITVTNSKALTISKTVDKDTQNAIKSVKWTITSDIPSDIATHYHSYTIKDKIATGLTYNNDLEVRLETSRLRSGAKKLSSGKDYKLTVDGNDITIELITTSPNISAGVLIVQYSTILDSSVFNLLGTEIGLAASLEYALEKDKIGDDYNIHSTTIETIPTVHVGSYWFKKVEKGTSTGLKGATFKLATTEEDAKAGNFITLYDTNENAITEFTSDSTGLVKIEGLAYGTYYLVETKAPDGYTLLKNPLKFVVSGASTNFEMNIENSKSLLGIADLPYFGGMGITIIILSGIALILIGVIITRIGKKEAEKDKKKFKD